MPEISNFLDLNAYTLLTNKTYNIRHDPNNIHRIFINPLPENPVLQGGDVEARN